MLIYCESLQKEIRLAAEKWRDIKVSTVFLGGGTPSIVPAQAMNRVMQTLKDSFEFMPDVEFTSEANPGTLTEEWLAVLQKHGLNRLSLGIQAVQDQMLKSIGRIHKFEDAKQAMALARHCGIQNLSVDLMFGLPEQELLDYFESIDTVCEFSPEHISAYSLILEQNTQLYDAVQQGKTNVPNEDVAAEMYIRGIERLQAHGYHQYEVSNFARDGCACRHNMGYWQGAWYLGLGVAAHSMLPLQDEQQNQHGTQGPHSMIALKTMSSAYPAVRLRHANTSDLCAYTAALSQKELPITEKQIISADDAMFETMMLGLRMTQGVGEADFLALHGKTLLEAYGQELSALVQDGLALWRKDGHFSLTPRGLALQNNVLLRLMK